ncbi:MAG: non-ribosomal peptide synthetase [Jatrophihabitantaceae bacterium]
MTDQPASPADSAAIPRRGTAVAEPPLSYAQEQLWFIDQYHCLPTWNVPGIVRFTGEFDVAAVAGAVTALVKRHEILRSRLVADATGRSVQLIDPPVRIELPELDLSDEPDPQARLTELAEAGALETFDLARGPLFRAELIKFSETDHALLLNAHQSVFDAWSFEVLMSELAALYDQEVSGTPAALPELPIQFADYAQWERDQLSGVALDRLFQYWRTQLSGYQAVQMPTDRPRPVAFDHSGRLASLDLGPELLTKLSSTASRAGTTPLVVLLTALQALLHRYTGQTDIMVGMADAGRTRPELVPLIGLVANTLPIRADVSGDLTFEELLAQARETTAAGYAHQALPFAKLIDLLQVERDTSRTPIFQVALSYREAIEPVQLPGVRLSLQPVRLMAAKYDLDFVAEARDGSLRLAVSYPPALYDPATVQRLLGHLGVLLEAALDDPTRRISSLPLLTAAELYDEVHGWNDTAADFPVICIHEQFELVAERYPDGIAGTYLADGIERTSLSYADLNADANRIGRRLVELGVGPEVLVGVCMRPSVRRLAVLLAIMKAGGGYVPLDPELPGERLSFLIDDTAMPVIVADLASEPGLPKTGATIVSLDAEWLAIMQRDADNLRLASPPSNVAYVIYTSGSTGLPKGVVVEHRHALNFLLGMIDRWRIGPGDRVLQFASLNFDVSVGDMFLTLCSGATAVLTDRQTLMSPPRLAELMRSERITFTCLPPAVVNLLTGQEFPDLRVLVSAGEELSSELVRAWLRPGLHFYNGYGPTEAAIGACFGEMDGAIFPPPIGRPKPNYQVYVLDQYLNPLPIGVIGELHIGGAGVTRGYLNRPELTAERFIKDPFRDVEGARLYKTGDLVKRLPDGNIAFVGRIDGQVKIRGLRVELGEIESALAAMPGVLQAVVTVINVAEKQLVGYLRLDLEASPGLSVADLRAELAQRLPAYMVPASLVVLDEFPLTHNGKIDKAALPAPETVSAESYVAPSTLIETVLVDMYATVLNQEQVGTENSFFDVGGSSLQAMQLVTRLRRDLAVDVDVTAIFLAPTPKQLAAVLRDKYGLEDVELDEQGLDGLIEQEPQPS